MERRIDERHQLLVDSWKDRMDAEEKIRQEHDSSLNARLEIMNGFRTQLDRQAGSFITWGTLLSVSVGVSALVEIVLRIIGK